MSFVKVLDIPDDKNVYFIGDIHGNYDLYKNTIDELGITDNDVIISVGDLIDRGKNNSKMLFEFLNHPNRHMVIGNHEDMMMRSLSSRDWRSTWLHNGGNTTLDEMGQPGVNHFCELLADIPVLLEVNHRGYKIGVAHAGIPHYGSINDWEEIKDWTMNNADYRYDLLWDRNAIQYARYDFEIPENEKLQKVITGVDYVIHGHTGVPDKFLFGNRVWIDTQFRSGKFTVAYMLNETKQLQFNSVRPDSWGVGFIVE